ncbi:sigma-70 family RNA polymerase sigma factor [Streptomyces sp. NPDC001904]|uniref:RNA polymerase sigma factor n=1 Tax=Streptomyces sp. NPDC001904 TaxID=3154531 RepID=UPI0033283F25
MRPLLPRPAHSPHPVAAETPPPAEAGTAPADAERDDEEILDLREADREVAIARLFDVHYARLLRLAVLVGAEGDAEDLVSEAFYQLHRRWEKLATPEAALSYLRSIVCNLARMRIRRLKVARRHTYHERERMVSSAEHQVLLNDAQRELVVALRTLSSRQRQALVLRYWMDLKESEIAETMKISVGAVKAHTARGMAKLTSVMKEEAR